MKLLLNLLILVILGPHLLLATTYYVGPGGSDGFNGLSLATSFRTLQKAANTVSAGDLVLVSDSTYAGFTILLQVLLPIRSFSKQMELKSL